MNKKQIRKELEIPSIRKFMEDNSGFLVGNVLDYGAGKQPYKDLVQGTYTPYDLDYGTIGYNYDTIMCNQVLEYVVDPARTIRDFYLLLKPNGILVITYPTTWEEVDEGDYWRFTKNGMERLLWTNGFNVLVHTKRCQLEFEDFNLAIGYGIVAQKY